MNYREIRPPRNRTARPTVARPRSILGILVLVLAVMVGGLGLTHILVRNKIHAVGRQQTSMEREMVALEEQMRDINMKIEESLSRKNLTDRLISNRSKLKSILPENIIRMAQNETTAHP